MTDRLPAKPIEDHCTEAGAKRLAARIERYWAAHGHPVRVRTVAAEFHHTMRSTRTDIRSDMLNGWPRGRA